MPPADRIKLLRLVLIGGLPGTGKSTLAAEIANITGWTLLRSDEVRKELVGLEPTAPASATFGHGLYSSELTELVYNELLDRAAEHLRHGRQVILDASWASNAHRIAARNTADDTASVIIEIRCILDSDEAAARMAARIASASDASDADVSVAEAMSVRFDPWTNGVEIPTSGDRERLLERALCELGL